MERKIDRRWKERQIKDGKKDRQKMERKIYRRMKERQIEDIKIGRNSILIIFLSAYFRFFFS